MWFADGGLRSVGYLRGRGGLEKCQGKGVWEAPLLSILDTVLWTKMPLGGESEGLILLLKINRLKA